MVEPAEFADRLDAKCCPKVYSEDFVLSNWKEGLAFTELEQSNFEGKIKDLVCCMCHLLHLLDI